MQQAPTIAGWPGDTELLPLPRRWLSVQHDGGVGADCSEEWEEEEEEEKHIWGTSHITLI